MRYDDATLERFNQKLLKKRETILEQLKSMRGDALHRADEENLEEDGSNTFVRSTDLSRAEELNNRLNSIEDALRAIKDKTYGICAVCHCQIPIKRLEAAPFVIRCVECKKKYEAAYAQDKRMQNN